jgi:hypothetical protein
MDRAPTPMGFILIGIGLCSEHCVQHHECDLGDEIAVDLPQLGDRPDAGHLERVPGRG